MRALVLACALGIAAGLTLPARGQESPAPASPDNPAPNAAELGRWIEEADRFREICTRMSSREVDERLRSDPRDKSPAARANRLFIGAVARFCAFGDFVLTGSDNGKCGQKVVLSEDHRAFLRQISTVREKAIHRIDLECVDVGGNFIAERIEAGSLRLQDVTANRIFIVSSKFSGEVAINNASVRADIFLNQLQGGGNLTIGQKIEIANGARWRHPLVVRDSSFRSVFIMDVTAQGGTDLRGLDAKGSLEIQRSHFVKGELRAGGISVGGAFLLVNSDIEDNADISNATIDRISFSQARFGADLTAHGLKTDQNFGFWEKSMVTGKIAARGMGIGGAFIISNSTLADAADFDHLRAERLTVNGSIIEADFSFRHAQLTSRTAFENKSTVKGALNALGARFGGTLAMEKSNFEKYVRFDYSEADRVVIDESTFDHTFDIEYARIGSASVEASTIKRTLLADYARIGALLMSNSTIAPSDCEGATCRIGLFNAAVDHFTLRGVKSRRLAAGNARFRVFIASGETDIEWLACDDCQVEQFALMGGRVTKAANLAGAEFKGTLAFSENAAKARWGPDATLDLSELRADTIAADACDLMVERYDNGRILSCAEQNAEQRQFVPTRLTGARYRTIVPGRQLTLDAEHEPTRPASASTVAGVKGAAMAAPVEPHKSGSGRLALLDLPPDQIVRFLVSSDPNVHNPQPYEEMADVLSRAGKNLEAIEIRVARINDRLERVETNPFIHAWYWLYYYVSHYGFKNWRAFVYFIGLIIIGAVIYHWGTRKEPAPAEGAVEHDQRTRTLYSVWFSLDRAVPPLRLDPRLEEELHLTPWVRQYFYFHRVAGTILISVFAAGLAGLGH